MSLSILSLRHQHRQAWWRLADGAEVDGHQAGRVLDVAETAAGRIAARALQRDDVSLTVDVVAGARVAVHAEAGTREDAEDAARHLLADVRQVAVLVLEHLERLDSQSGVSRLAGRQVDVTCQANTRQL